MLNEPCGKRDWGRGSDESASSHYFHLLLLLLLLLPLTAFAFPAAHEARLPNGLRILLLPAPNVPMVTLKLVIPAGSRFDAPGKGGSSSLLAAMLADHTARHDHDGWGLLLDNESAQFGAGADQDGVSLGVTVLSESLEFGVQRLAEAALEPGWNVGRLAILQADTYSAIQKALENPESRVFGALPQLLYGANHPYGHPTEGSLTTIPAININDLRQLYAARIAPNEAVLAVSGDTDMAKLLPLIEAAFGQWQTKSGERLFDLKVPEQAVGQNRAIVMETKQSHLLLARLGISRNDPDLFPMIVLNHLLGGGGFSSRLMTQVRERRGLAYSVASASMPLAAAGPLIAMTQTRADQSGQARSVMLDVLRDLYGGHISASELQATKDNLIGGFALRLDSNHERVDLLATTGFYGKPADYLAHWTKRIESVTLSDVQRVAHKYLEPGSWLTIQAGPPGSSDK